MKPTKPLKTTITLSVDKPIVEKIRILAEEDERPISSYINLILRRHLRNFEVNEEIRKSPVKDRSAYGNKPSKTRLSVSLDGPMVEKLRVLAEEEDRQLSPYINLILRSYLHNLEAGGMNGTSR